MDFFEQLGKKISDASQNVAQQTKNFADTTKLNSAISDKEKKISSLFLSLGQAYYEGHKDDAGAEQKEIIDEINGLYAEIADNKEQIKQIKGVEKCPKCGADVPLNSTFCSVCGTKIERAVEEKKEEIGRKCPKCGATVADGDSFCNACGTKVD